MNALLPRIGLVGWPLEHSFSPVIHEFWMRKAGLQKHRYELLPTPPDKFIARLKTLTEEGFVGCNITVPYKEAAFSFLDKYGELDAEARRLRAVNTILVDKHGKMEGRNSDGVGFLASLDQQSPHWRSREFSESNQVVIFGAGGAARSIIASLVDSGIEHIYIVNRTKKRAERLLQQLNIKNARAFSTSREELISALKNAPLLINSTSLGMTGYCNWRDGIGSAPSEFLTYIDSSAIVVDIVYIPLQTELLQTAFKYGFTCVNGLGMLLYQAVPSFEGWFGVRPTVSSELRAILEQSIEN